MEPRKIVFMFGMFFLSQIYSQTLNLECQVQGKQTILMKQYAGQVDSIGPALISVIVQNKPGYLNIEIVGNPPFKTGGLHLKGSQSQNTSGSFDNQLIKVTDKTNANSTTVIEINRMTGLMNVYEKFNDADSQSTTNYSGVCRSSTTQTF
jgi:hypothetical protein